MNAQQQIGREHFDRNMHSLQKRFPHVVQILEQERTRDPFLATIREGHGGRPVLCARTAGKPSFPLYADDALEMLFQRIDETAPPEPFDMVFLVGIGMGEACLKIIRRFENKPRIAVIEPYPALFRLAIATQEFGTLLDYERISFYVGSQANGKQIVEESKPVLFAGRNIVFTYPYQHQDLGRGLNRVKNELTDNIHANREMWKTTRLHGGQMLNNTIANLDSLLNGTPLRLLKRRFKGVPIVCVAAGPSLEEALPLLKRADTALILASDSAVGNLLKAGIRPDIIATTDIHEGNIRKLAPHMDSLGDAVLVFGMEANPQVVGTFPGSRRVGLTAYSRLILDWFDPALNLQCQLPPMTTVTQFTVLLAMALGADPIVLVGVDLAYLNGKSHADGSVNSKISQNQKLIPAKSVDGGIVYAPSQLVTDRVLLEQIIAEHSVRVINVGTAGALIRGAENQSLERVIETELSIGQDGKNILKRIPWETSTAAAKKRSQLTKTIKAFKAFIKECQQLSKDIHRSLPTQDSQPVNDIGPQAFLTHKQEYLLFLQKQHKVIESLHNAMLNEIQERIIKEEIAMTARDESMKKNAMADELQMIASTCDTFINWAKSVVGGLEAVLEKI